MLNDPTMVDAATALASRLLRQSELSDRERLELGFRLATARLPDAKESEALLRFLRKQQSYYEKQVDEAHELMESVDRYSVSKSADPVALAAWTATSRAILNLYETVSRN